MTYMRPTARLLEGELQLPPPAFAAHRAECPVAHCITQRSSRFSFEGEPKSCRESSRAPGPGWIIMKASRMQDAKPSPVQVLEPAFEIDDWHRLRRIRSIERAEHCVDAEVAPVQILFETPERNVWQRARLGISLAAKSGQVDLRLGRRQSQCPESLVRLDLDRFVTPILNDGGGEFTNVGLDDQVDVDNPAVQEQIPNWPPHEMDRHLLRAGDPNDPLEQITRRLGQSRYDLFETKTPLHRLAPDPRGCRDSTVSRSFLRLTWV